MELLARTCNTERMNVQRIMARFMLILGGVFWVSMVWGAAWVYQGAPFQEAAGGALIYAIAIAVVFVIGLFYEYVAALLLALAAAGVVVYGLIMGWWAALWATMFFFFILPLIVSAVLYYMAAQMQKVCTMEGQTL